MIYFVWYDDCIIMIHIEFIVNEFGLRQIFIKQSSTYDYDL